MDQFLDFEVNGMFEQNFWCINFISISIWKTLELKKDKRMCFEGSRERVETFFARILAPCRALLH